MFDDCTVVQRVARINIERVQGTPCILTNMARNKNWRNGLSPGDVVVARCSIQNDNQNRFKARPAIILVVGNNRREVVLVPMSSKSGYAVGTYIDPTDNNGMEEQGIALFLNRQSRPIQDVHKKIGFLSKSVFMRVLRDCNM